MVQPERHIIVALKSGNKIHITEEDELVDQWDKPVAFDQVVGILLHPRGVIGYPYPVVQVQEEGMTKDVLSTTYILNQGVESVSKAFITPAGTEKS